MTNLLGALMRSLRGMVLTLSSSAVSFCCDDGLVNVEFETIESNAENGRPHQVEQCRVKHVGG
jgi:hypothetical protein